MARNLLKKAGYIKEDEDQPEVIRAALQKYRKENPYIQPRFPNDLGQESDCSTCRDRHWLYPIGQGGKPDYSKVVPCECTKEETQSTWIKKELERAGIPDTCANSYTFDNFQLVQGTENAFKAAKAFDIKLRESTSATGAAPYSMLMLYGPCGNGKTMLLYATYCSAIKAGLRAKFEVWPELVAKAKQTIGTTANFEEVFASARECDVLFLDEVKFKANNWESEKFEDIINHRFKDMLPTMITTNHDKSEFPPAVVSRFSDSTICKLVHNTGNDYRKIKKARRAA
jgi:DNA replication protein DnaC